MYSRKLITIILFIHKIIVASFNGNCLTNKDFINNN